MLLPDVSYILRNFSFKTLYLADIQIVCVMPSDGSLDMIPWDGCVHKPTSTVWNQISDNLSKRTYVKSVLIDRANVFHVLLLWGRWDNLIIVCRDNPLYCPELTSENSPLNFELLLRCLEDSRIKDTHAICPRSWRYRCPRMSPKQSTDCASALVQPHVSARSLAGGWLVTLSSRG